LALLKDLVVSIVANSRLLSYTVNPFKVGFFWSTKKAKSTADVHGGFAFEQDDDVLNLLKL